MKYKLMLAAASAHMLSAPALAQEHDHSVHERHAPVPPASGDYCVMTLETSPGKPVNMACREHAEDHSDHQAGDHSSQQAVETTPAAFWDGRCVMAMGYNIYVHADGSVTQEAEPALAAKTCFFSPGSGTARLPANEGGMHGLHLSAGDWMVMAHGTASLQYTSVSGPRGDDKLYATSMAMLTAERATSFGRIQLKSMLSLEPAMEANGYPNLFATGETAGGLPLVDRQHPHDLFMELAARVDFNLGEDTSLFVYGGPVGEPALGPSAFVHRASAQYNPEPPIAHHWFDSTHITYGVVTAGLASKTWQIEASAFRGREPDERRWNIEKPKLDSWSVRATLTPSPAWALQASYAEIEKPEALHPGEDEHRFTASAHYANGRGLTAMLAFSAKDRVPGDTLTAWLGEASWEFDARNTIFGRIENVANDELFPDHDHPLHDRTFRISKFQLGYARRIPLGPVELALGGSVAAYAKPDALDAVYGKNPMGYTVFARFTLGQ